MLRTPMPEFMFRSFGNFRARLPSRGVNLNDYSLLVCSIASLRSTDACASQLKSFKTFELKTRTSKSKLVI